MKIQQKQVTFAPRNHILTNINVWTPDSCWLVFDVRPSSASFTGQTIEQVNITNGDIAIIYTATDGAYVGAATINPGLPLQYVFIHGPENPDEQWHYDFHHRRGVIVTPSLSNCAITLDAMDITPPFTPGALRGGSHVHVFSPQGNRLSFTYNDHILHEYNAALDQRNVAVAVPLNAVNVIQGHSREYCGSHFCVLVSQTSPQPALGSDEISRAYEDAWVGEQGYYHSNGAHQRWALAFIGDTWSDDGKKVAEVFIVDLPDELAAYTKEGEYPLSGTEVSLPAPPKGVKQRRLTITTTRRYPGVVTTPRHWLRSSPDGNMIAFLMQDDYGVIQLWFVSPNGGDVRQMTTGSHNVNSAFSWSPDGRLLAFVMDNSIVTCDAASGVIVRRTSRTTVTPSPDAVVFSPDGKKIAFMCEVDGFSQLFYVAIDNEWSEEHEEISELTL